MKISFITGLGVLAISLLLVGCQTSGSTENESAENETASASSEAQEQTSEGEHNHSHSQDDETEQIYKGYFDDSQVKGRSLSDWKETGNLSIHTYKMVRLTWYSLIKRNIKVI